MSSHRLLTQICWNSTVLNTTGEDLCETLVEVDIFFIPVPVPTELILLLYYSTSSDTDFSTVDRHIQYRYAVR